MMNRSLKIVSAMAVLGMIAILIACSPGSTNQVPPSTDVKPCAVPSRIPKEPVVIPPEDGSAVITFATYSFLSRFPKNMSYFWREDIMQPKVFGKNASFA
jgi:hypothetical protein